MVQAVVVHTASCRHYSSCASQVVRLEYGYLIFNSLPMVNVKLIGRKIAGLVGSSLLCMRWRLPLHHGAGAKGFFNKIFEKRLQDNGECSIVTLGGSRKSYLAQEQMHWRTSSEFLISFGLTGDKSDSRTVVAG